ncbi:MAG: GDSL-type esterase/lipase family protein, partial [Pirellulaceae bacterium]|nr:GDSL-type esterase/lipase family protein [Pirellulaceae bacterium]
MNMTTRTITIALTISFAASIATAAEPHAVFVIGTPHYSPGDTLPPLAKQLERFGFRTTVVTAKGNPERNAAGLPGIEALRTADVAIFFARFLTLPDDQLGHVEEYLKSGRPVVGFRTSTHAFAYPGGDVRSKWNNGFGADALGSRYFIHLRGGTRVTVAEGADRHPILNGVEIKKERAAAGTLYLVDLPSDATPLLIGSGDSKRTGKVKNSFGEHVLKATMTEDVAWTWRNKWGGRVFATTLGHPQTFADPNWVRLFINGIHWAADRPVPKARTRVDAIGQRTSEQTKPRKKKKKAGKSSPDGKQDAKNKQTGKPAPPRDPELAQYGVYAKSAPRAESAEPIVTELPIALAGGTRIALVGNGLLEQAQHFGHLETLLHQRYPRSRLVVRNLAWAADTPDLQPRPDNFADLEQHLTHERPDVIIAAFGFNESFAGEAGVPAFRQALTKFVESTKVKAFNGKSAPRIVLLSPIANENVAAVAAADLNNRRLRSYAQVVRDVAAQQQVGFVDVFAPTSAAMESPGSDLTFNGVHLEEKGYAVLANAVYRGLFDEPPPTIDDAIRQVVIDKNRQYFRRFRPLNTFYYTGGRSKTYGYLDFLPAMRNFDALTANRDERIWDLAQGKTVPAKIDDSNLPPLPKTAESRGANRWISAAEELKAFRIDPRFDVNLFAGEEEFPDIAAPIQMRWDARGRLWVSCSTTYPHVYPGNAANDKLVILEDADGDGRADKSTVFADNLHIPLSFEFGDGGVYVSEMPHLTFIKDTDGDGKADFRRRVLTGFGTEDSHHSLHDFAWTPDGDLIFRESIFHHSQVETAYGPIRQQNSGWFRFQPRTQRLTSFGTYHSTNPWGVTFDDWGQHVASHPVFASAFHATDPPYPHQHPKPTGLRAYSGTCGQEFIDFATFPDEMRGGFVKVRYKPTNRVEFHRWREYDYGYDEEYVGDLIFSTNLSFIPVDLRYGPRGALYVCDWYNPIKGHAQYSLRDERRDRHSGRIWRITTKGKPLQDPPAIAGQSIRQLLDLLKRSEYRYRYWAKRELRDRNTADVLAELDRWVAQLAPDDPRYRHHQVEAIWMYRNIDAVNTALLVDVLRSANRHARAAATRQLRYWHAELPNATELLRRSANDPSGLVRLEAVIAASYIGSKAALDALLEATKHPHEKHLSYAIQCSLGSASLRRHWENNKEYNIPRLLRRAARSSELKEPTPSASQAEFDSQKGLKSVTISCLPERMKFTVEQFAVKTGQPVKIVFTNPDATDHNLVLVRPGALEEVGLAANEMARDPRNANSDFIPESRRSLILQASPMIGPTRKSRIHVMRFIAPDKPGVYPYVCTFPGHWVVMKGLLVVARDLKDAPAMLAAAKPQFVREWKVSDFAGALENRTASDKVLMSGMQAFIKARCNQCHVVKGHGVNLGPDLTDVVKRFKGDKLLRQMIDPSTEINEKYQTHQFLLDNGKVITGVVVKEDPQSYHVVTNMLIPEAVTRVAKRDIDERFTSKLSPMPLGLANVLTKQEIVD